MPTALGIPDVNYIYGWIELKSVSQWPKRGGPLPVPHYKPEQRVWGMKRWLAGGLSWVLLRVEKEGDWLLFQGNVACEVLGRSTKDNLFAAARTSVKSPVDLTILRDLKVQ